VLRSRQITEALAALEARGSWRSPARPGAGVASTTTSGSCPRPGHRTRQRRTRSRQRGSSRSHVSSSRTSGCSR
jgi:hypothetical protein